MKVHWPPPVYLSFLVNQYGGEIKTFAIVGALNIDLVHEIEGIETSLGSVDSKAGLRYEQSLQDLEKRKASTAATRAEDALAEKLRRHANDIIKPNREYGRSGYNINDIKADLKQVRDNAIPLLTEEGLASKKALLKEDQLAPIGTRVEFSPTVEILQADASALLQRKIAPNAPIQELLNDSILQHWVKTGVAHHRGKRDTCAFCNAGTGPALRRASTFSTCSALSTPDSTTSSTATSTAASPSPRTVAWR